MHCEPPRLGVKRELRLQALKKEQQGCSEDRQGGTRTGTRTETRGGTVEHKGHKDFVKRIESIMRDWKVLEGF